MFYNVFIGSLVRQDTPCLSIDCGLHGGLEKTRETSGGIKYWYAESGWNRYLSGIFG